MSEARQRWRLVFSRGEDARYLSHLDTVKVWERSFRRGEIPIAMTEGFSPRPRLVFAAPLALGMLAEHELADLLLAERLTSAELRERLSACMPPGYVVLEMFDVWTGAPAIAPQLRAADYRLTLLGAAAGEIAPAAGRLLGASTLPRVRKRETKAVTYDLRPLILDLRVAPVSGGRGGDAETASSDLWFRLLHTQDRGTGRPTEVVAALAVEAGLEYRPPLEGEDEGEPAARGSTAEAGTASSGRALEIVHPVRERLWLAGELDT